MLTRRNCLLRISIFINLIVLLHFGTHILISKNGANIIRKMQDSGRNLASFELFEDNNEIAQNDKKIDGRDEDVHHEKSEQRTIKENNLEKNDFGRFLSSKDIISAKDVLAIKNNFIKDEPSSWDSASSSDSTNTQTVNTDLNTVALICNNNNLNASEVKTKRTLSDIINCEDIIARYFIAQKGDFWVLYNYIIASRKFHCWESITYTSHSDYTFLDNLVPLLDRWQGPISLALYAPGTDFYETLNTIRYLRECTSPLVAEFVTFHIYFGTRHAPNQIPKPSNLFTKVMNCSILPPWTNTTASPTYKTQRKLLYPVNVGRNIARQTALTHYILASDIELYPSPGIITDFLDMVLRQDPPLRHKKPKVFPLSIFEVEANKIPPGDKTELVAMLKNGSAIPFHKKVCPGCHNVPKSKEWVKAPVKSGLHVFHIGKRMGYFVHWEPIYIGTNQEPYYDERLSWEGKSDKMTQGYTMCVLDYEFQILDNAFLVHKPGIKTLKKDHARAVLAGKTNLIIRKVIVPELRILYGFRKGCAV